MWLDIEESWEKNIDTELESDEYFMLKNIFLTSDSKNHLDNCLLCYLMWLFLNDSVHDIPSVSH